LDSPEQLAGFVCSITFKEIENGEEKSEKRRQEKEEEADFFKIKPHITKYGR